MLFVYNKGVYKEYFETEYSENVKIPDEVVKINASVDISKHQYVVGNDLNVMGFAYPYQTFIDVTLFGIDYDLMDKLGLEAIVYVYNQWYIRDNIFMDVSAPINEYLLRPIPENAIYTKVSLMRGNKRFDQMRQEVNQRSKSEDFVGVIWPTCHYLADINYMTIIYSNTRVIKQTEAKPIPKLI